jgi:hypothetical protein
MPILAGMKTVAILLARLTEKDFAAELFGATSDNLFHDRAVTLRHALAVLLQVGGAIFAENIREFDPSLWLRTRFVFWETFTDPP